VIGEAAALLDKLADVVVLGNPLGVPTKTISLEK